MKIAVIGSRNISVSNIEKYMPFNVTCIVSGGAKGIDSVAREYAELREIPLIEYLPKYNMYGRYAPLKRNIEICENSDMVIAFWDGESRGTKFVIDYCTKHNKDIEVYIHVKDSDYMPYFTG